MLYDTTGTSRHLTDIDSPAATAPSKRRSSGQADFPILNIWWSCILCGNQIAPDVVCASGISFICLLTYRMKCVGRSDSRGRVRTSDVKLIRKVFSGDSGRKSGSAPCRSLTISWQQTDSVGYLVGVVLSVVETSTRHNAVSPI